MPCCSAYDALSAPLEPALTADDPLAATPLATTSLDPITTTDGSPTLRPVPPDFDCHGHQCWEKLHGGQECASGTCVRGKGGAHAPAHPRPRCPVHEPGASGGSDAA